jgi:hypothetical protein
MPLERGAKFPNLINRRNIAPLACARKGRRISMPLALSDEQMSAVLAAAEPLAPSDRSQFLQALADALRNEPMIGDGVLARTIRHVIRPFFRPPTGTAGPQPHRRNVGEPIA